MGDLENALPAVSAEDQRFIHSMKDRMSKSGFSNALGPGYCWGRSMITFKKRSIKNPPNAARIYIRDKGIVLRFYLPNIPKHRRFIESAKPKIKDVFTNDFGSCNHCHNDKSGRCNFRRSYQIDGLTHEKCSGHTFQFFEPALEDIDDYMELFQEFYPPRSPDLNVTEMP